MRTHLVAGRLPLPTIVGSGGSALQHAHANDAKFRANDAKFTLEMNEGATPEEQQIEEEHERKSETRESRIFSGIETYLGWSKGWGKPEWNDREEKGGGAAFGRRRLRPRLAGLRLFQKQLRL